MKINTLSIIIPAYNEAATIEELLKQIISLNLIQEIKKEIIIIDDCSGDNTAQLVNKVIAQYPHEKIQFVRKNSNEGKGAAIKTGIMHASGEYIIIQDADLELVPTEINLLLEPILNDKANVVYGSRFLNQSESTKKIKDLANWFLTSLTNITCNIRLTDMETCYKLIKTEMIKNMPLRENRFGFEPEITVRLSKIPNVKFAEVPITYNARTYEHGKKINWKDGVRAIYCIIYYKWFDFN